MGRGVDDQTRVSTTYVPTPAIVYIWPALACASYMFSGELLLLACLWDDKFNSVRVMGSCRRWYHFAGAGTKSSKKRPARGHGANKPSEGLYSLSLSLPPHGSFPHSFLVPPSALSLSLPPSLLTTALQAEADFKSGLLEQQQLLGFSPSVRVSAFTLIIDSISRTQTYLSTQEAMQGMHMNRYFVCTV